MVASISTKTITDLNASSLYTGTLTKETESIEDTIEISSTKDNDGLFKIMSKLKVSDMESFEKSYNCIKGSDENADINKLYNDYLSYRGCNSSEDLKALNSTDFETRSELEIDAKNKFIMCLLMLSTLGLDTSKVADKENINSIIASSSTKDLANFVNDCNKSIENKNSSGMLSAFNQFIKSASENSELGEGLQKALKELGEKLTSQIKELAIENLYEEKNQPINIYNQKLISKYKQN